MSAKRKLVRFIKLKDKIIKELTGISYIDEEDIRDILSWYEEMCEAVIKEMLRNKIYKANDATICPWCMEDYLSDYSERYCEGCEYALRHGNCADDESLYKKIYYTAEEKSITDIIGARMEELLRILEK